MGSWTMVLGRTTGTGMRMIIVHAITTHGPFVSCDSNGVPIQEGLFKPKSKGKGREDSSDFKMKDEDTAEFLWQVKLSKGELPRVND